MRLFIFAAGFFAALVHPTFAQIIMPAAKPPSSIVTVLSDGLSEPASPASQVLSELSIILDKESEVRLLSINGYGGPTNVRDLLQLRGTDLAIVNSDILAYLDLASVLPEARRKVRLIAPLFHQTVFVLARQSIKSIGDLRGRKIGIRAGWPSRGITARTAFGLLKIKAEFLELDDKELARRAGEVDALLLYENDLPGLQTLGITPASYHLLAIPVQGPLAAVYLPKKLGKNAITGFSSADTVETIQVASLLAAFDWSEKQNRYTEVVSFVEKFFAVVPQFRTRYPHSPFSRTDIRANLPGWKRFGPAEALAAAATPPVQVKEDSPPLIASSNDTLRVIAVARPPLTDAQDKDGGVALKILTGALGAAGVPVSVQWVYSERALLDGIITSKTGDIGLFAQSPHCDAPSNQSAGEAELCDRAVLTEPLMHAVAAVFTRIDMPLDPNSPDAAKARTFCVPEGQTVPNETLANIPWVKAATIKTFRPKTLIACLAAVDQREADALIAIEPEARFTIEKLKLSQSFQISQRPDIPIGLHAVLAKDNPRQTQLIQIINEALKKFKEGGGYSTVMASHLADLTGASIKEP